MGLADWWNAFRTKRLSKPAEDRVLFQATEGKSVQSVLEIGLGDGSRCRRLIDWLALQDCQGLRYAAIDMFEAGGGIPLKQFHSLVTGTGNRPLPVPGTLVMGLPRIAHTIGAVDLVILSDEIAAVQDPAIQSFLPRIVHPSTIILAQDEDGFLYNMTTDELLAQQSVVAAA